MLSVTARNGRVTSVCTISHYRRKYQYNVCMAFREIDLHILLASRYNAEMFYYGALYRGTMYVTRALNLSVYQQ